MIKILTVFLILLHGAQSLLAFSYQGYKVYSVYTQNYHQHYILDNIQQDDSMDFWIKRSLPNQQWVVMVPPMLIEPFEDILKINNFTYEIIIDNVARDQARTEPNSITFTQYHRYGTISRYMKELANKFPETVTLLKLGITTEHRQIFGVKISSSSGNSEQHPAILIDAGINPREWIGIAAALYIINELIENPDNSEMYQKVDWYIIPVVNPDGYEFSHINDRMWKKNRSKGKQCLGVDLNRNWDFHWGESGVKNLDDCEADYIGPKAASELEVQALKNFTLKNKSQIKLYLSLHSFGPMILYPWGYTSNATDNEGELKAVGEAINQAIWSLRGMKYTVGSSNMVLYPSSGSSVDWMMGVAGINLSYSFHVATRGTNFFDPYNSSILQSVKDAFVGVTILQKYIEFKNPN